MPGTYEVPALKRAHEILAILANACAPVRASALADITGMSRSTLYLLLDSLERRRWIERKPEGYLIGLTLFQLGSAYVRHDRLHDVFRREAAAFVAMHNEVVQLAMLDGREVVYLAREDASRPVRLVSDLGSRLPAHCCALGKALLASLTDEAVIALLPARLEPVTQRSVVRRADLLQELATVRKSGIAYEREEVSAGLTCFASFVGTTAPGRRIAISTSLPIDRLDKGREKRIVVDLVGTASRIGKMVFSR